MLLFLICLTSHEHVIEHLWCHVKGAKWYELDDIVTLFIYLFYCIWQEKNKQNREIIYESLIPHIHLINMLFIVLSFYLNAYKEKHDK